MLGVLTLLDPSGPTWPVGDDFTFTFTPTTKITKSSLGSTVSLSVVLYVQWSLSQYQEIFPYILNVLIATITLKSDQVEGPGEKEQVFKREHADSLLVTSMNCYKFDVA